MADTVSFSDLLRAYRERTGLSQEQAARRLGISRNYVSQIERGLAHNVSFELGTRILNLGATHGKIEVDLVRRVSLDATIATEVVWLNVFGVVTEASCQGPPPTALIKPSSVGRARELGYEPELTNVGLYQIQLKSRVDGGAGDGSRCMYCGRTAVEGRAFCTEHARQADKSARQKEAERRRILDSTAAPSDGNQEAPDA